MTEENEIGKRELSKTQLLKYAKSIAELYENERIQRTALEQAIKNLQSEISKRRQLQRELIESERKYRYLFESSRMAGFVTSRDGMLIDANDAFLELFGYERDEIVGSSVLPLYADPALRDLFRERAEGDDGVTDFEVQVKKKDNSLTRCKISANVLKGPDGSIMGYHGIIRDVTEEERMRTVRELAERMEALGRMAGRVAHEIRNPLAISSSAAQLLMNNGLSRDIRKDCAEKIVTGMNRVSNIIENLLIFARPLKQWDRHSVDLIDILTEALGSFRRTAAGKNVELRFETECNQLAIPGEPELLRRAFLNLFSNAFGAMPRGGTLTVTVSATEGESIVTVADTGTGILEEHLSHIFDPFFSVRSAAEGIGLGLSVTYTIIRRHGGHIEVDAASNNGTTFFVRLPREQFQTEQQECRCLSPMES
ncbi:MAG: ATP-binding protein [Pseudomonadota bacterium]